MDNLLLCRECGWSGQEKECTKGYRGVPGDWDTEPYPVCPKCGSENLIELDSRGTVPEPILV